VFIIELVTLCLKMGITTLDLLPDKTHTYTFTPIDDFTNIL
jgi:hypothetical protein